MDSKESNTSSNKQEEWLDLRLGGYNNLSPSFKNQGPRSPRRVFSCNFCMRKFWSSQALGGHQNAHKRERVRSSSMNLDVGTSMFRSLGVQPHSFVRKRRSWTTTMTAKFDCEGGRGFGWLPVDVGEEEEEETAAAGLVWPGSFRYDPRPEEKEGIPDESSNMIDLNLKL